VTQGDYTVTGGDGDDTIDAHFDDSNGHTTLTGDNGNDSIVGGRGPDTISGGAGNDTLDSGGSSGPVGDLLTGGPGQDQFNIAVTWTDGGGVPFPPKVTDWETGDRLHFDISNAGPGAAANYSETSAADAAAALAAARATVITGSALHYLAVQVGADVLVFAVSASEIDEAVLTGRSLADIDFSNIV
jgi:hypothetical protein